MYILLFYLVILHLNTKIISQIRHRVLSVRIHPKICGSGWVGSVEYLVGWGWVKKFGPIYMSDFRMALFVSYLLSAIFVLKVSVTRDLHELASNF